MNKKIINKPVRVGFWNNNYIEYESKIRPYLKDIINNLKKFDTWKAQLTIAINLISSEDNDEERYKAFKK